jgi:preprotein translocase subunit SecE
MADSDKKSKERSALSRARRKSKSDAVASARKNASQQNKRRRGWGEYFRGVKLETKKVVWPTRQETISYTIIVIVACVFFGVFLWGVDSGFLFLIKNLFNIALT